MNKEIKVKVVKENKIILSNNYISYIEYIKDIKNKNSFIDNVESYDKIVNKRFNNKKRIFKRLNVFVNSVNEIDIKNIFNIDKKEIIKLLNDYKKVNKVNNVNLYNRI